MKNKTAGSAHCRPFNVGNDGPNLPASAAVKTATYEASPCIATPESSANQRPSDVGRSVSNQPGAETWSADKSRPAVIAVEPWTGADKGAT